MTPASRAAPPSPGPPPAGRPRRRARACGGPPPPRRRGDSGEVALGPGPGPRPAPLLPPPGGGLGGGSAPLPASTAAAGRSSRRRPGRDERFHFVKKKNQTKKPATKQIIENNKTPLKGRAGVGGAENRARCAGDAVTLQKPKPKCPWGTRAVRGWGSRRPPEPLLPGRDLPASPPRSLAAAPVAVAGGRWARGGGSGGGFKRPAGGFGASPAAGSVMGAAPVFPEPHWRWSSRPASTVLSNWT